MSEIDKAEADPKAPWNTPPPDPAEACAETSPDMDKWRQCTEEEFYEKVVECAYEIHREMMSGGPRLTIAIIRKHFGELEENYILCDDHGACLELQVAKLQAENDMLFRSLWWLRRLLEKTQYAIGEGECPVCYSDRCDGHTPECELAQALNPKEAENDSRRSNNRIT